MNVIKKKIDSSGNVFWVALTNTCQDQDMELEIWSTKSYISANDCMNKLALYKEKEDSRIPVYANDPNRLVRYIAVITAIFIVFTAPAIFLSLIYIIFTIFGM